MCVKCVCVCSLQTQQCLNKVCQELRLPDKIHRVSPISSAISYEPTHVVDLDLFPLEFVFASASHLKPGASLALFSILWHSRIWH